ncbi:Hypothetical protein CAP_0449 [Chondromyces apiculatus DSM 436]|uniref:Uncharacterized protein n=1 Tax=Chondromyces apiculatus DSM 436 TaxID=1192034 RepID=A0A017SUD7_9BACT|nr:Hypothetical protein CAP_0449 [Chondromyces apiculatus DSM 436]
MPPTSRRCRDGYCVSQVRPGSPARHSSEITGVATIGSVGTQGP